MGFRDMYGEKSYEDVTGFFSLMDKQLVTCGKCGMAFEPEFHNTHVPNDKGELLITCPYCKTEDETCWFPDLFY